MLSSCSSCPTNVPIFDGQKCVACPEFTYFNGEAGACLKCENGKTYNIKTKNCECGNDKPIWTGNECVACFLPKYYDYDANLCKSCPNGQYFDRPSKQCVNLNQ